MSKLILVGTSDDYNTQRNNKVIPWSSCNDTSEAMGLEITGWDKTLPVPEGMQLEDYISTFFQSQEAKDKLNSLYPNPLQSIGTDQPNEVHATLEWGVNLLIKRAGGPDQLTKFRTDWSVKNDFLPALQDGRPIVLSGHYPCWSNAQNKIITIGHITILVGIELDDSSNPIRYIVNDPYGDPHTNYASDKGYNISLTPQEWLSWINNQGSADSKWGHIFLSKKSA